MVSRSGVAEPGKSARVELNLSAHGLPDHLNRQLEQDLLYPAREFLGRSGKGIRRKLVCSGWCWQKGEHPDTTAQDLCEQLGHAMELVHSASLIIDDIQDASSERRGGKAMHLQIGMPKAINLGNWLYFQGFERLDSLNVSAEKRMQLSRLFRRALLNGHVGQALDLGVPMAATPRTLVFETSETSIRLKTGALTGLAFAGGAVLAGGEMPEAETAFSLGEEIGFILQAYDDLKNLKDDPQAVGKQYEDLKNQRPGLVWSIAASHPDSACWEQLILAAQELPERQGLNAWLAQFDILKRASELIDGRAQKLRATFARPEIVDVILTELKNAYAKI